MAIIFTKSLPKDKMLQAFNNNIIRFHSNIIGTPEKAILNGLGMTNVILYPNPNGSFYFNFKDYITANLNTKNFAGEFGFNFSAPGATFQTAATEDYYTEGDINIKIIFSETVLSNDEINISLCFALGVEQITDRFTNQFLNTKKRNWLTPQNSNGNHYVKYWRGYPIEVAYMLGYDYPTGMIDSIQVDDTIINFYNLERVNYLHLSDGINELLSSSQKIIRFENLIIEQAEGECGVYMKFRNKYGKWNYWLFDGNHFNNRSSKAIGELYNDFNDVSETVSPIIQIGRTADSTIKVQGDRLTENEKLIVEELIDSPKIYYFIGQPNTIPSETDWIEVSLKTNSFITRTPKKKVYKYTIEFDLPNRYTQTL